MNATRGIFCGLPGGRGRGRGPCPRHRLRGCRYGSSSHLRRAEAVFCAREETADVLVMLKDDDERNEDVTGDQDGCVRGGVRKREYREERCGDDRRKRDVSREEDDDQED